MNGNKFSREHVITTFKKENNLYIEGEHDIEVNLYDNLVLFPGQMRAVHILPSTVDFSDRPGKDKYSVSQKYLIFPKPILEFIILAIMEGRKTQMSGPAKKIELIKNKSKHEEIEIYDSSIILKVDGTKDQPNLKIEYKKGLSWYKNSRVLRNKVSGITNEAIK